MNIPKTLAVGDSIAWTDEATTDNLGNDISAPDWTLNYAIRGSTTLDIEAVTNGSGWLSTITAADSSGLAAGIYYWQAFAVNGSERKTLGKGQIQITADLEAVSGTYDGRSQLEQDIAAIETAYRAMITGGAVAEYTIGGRSLRKISLADLIMLRDKLKLELRNQKAADAIASGLNSPKTIKVRFT